MVSALRGAGRVATRRGALLAIPVNVKPSRILGAGSMAGRIGTCDRNRRSLAADLLLAVEPENMQAQSLRQLIERAVTRDGYIGAWRAPPPRSVITFSSFSSQRIGLASRLCALGSSGRRIVGSDSAD
jgi:hypothetical protein